MPPAKVEESLAAALVPYDMNQPPEGNPNGRLDWWRIDGADAKYAVRPEHEGDPRLIHPVISMDGEWPLLCDGGPRGLLDFDATRANAVGAARRWWEAEQRDWRRLVAEHPPALPLSAFLARHHADPEGYPRKQAVADHHRQPLVEALNRQHPEYSYLAIFVLGPDSDPVGYYNRDPQSDLDTAAAWAIVTNALVTVDGRWLDTDDPGPFGETLPGEGRKAAFARHVTSYLEGLDDDCVIVRLRCHG